MGRGIRAKWIVGGEVSARSDSVEIYSLWSERSSPPSSEAFSILDPIHSSL
jgi:hypothetical protein